MAYYDNPEMLQIHFDKICSMSAKTRDMLHVVIVDDASPRWPAQPRKLNGVPLQIYRVTKDVRWNQDAARNIGVRHSETEWVMLTDMDHLVTEETWESLYTRDWDKSVAYTFRRVSAPAMEPYKYHPNSWFMSRTLYDKIGGYDERFAGYYGTDADFRERLTAAAEIKQLKQALIRYPRTLVPDASTTTYLRKQPDDRVMISRIKAKRGDAPPLRGQFAYEQVYVGA
jgi:hypothetical protein